MTSGIAPKGQEGDATVSRDKVHEKSIETIEAELGTSLTEGLTKAKAKELFLSCGPNELEKPPRISLLTLFLVQLNSVIMYLLLAAVVASAVIKATGDKADEFLSYVDSIAILTIVLINATIAAVTENNANDALEKLSSLQALDCTVIRDGEDCTVPTRDLVPGDIVKMETGDVVPADLRVIEVPTPPRPTLPSMPTRQSPRARRTARGIRRGCALGVPRGAHSAFPCRWRDGS